jgi:hypothetical protein
MSCLVLGSVYQTGLLNDLVRYLVRHLATLRVRLSHLSVLDLDFRRVLQNGSVRSLVHYLVRHLATLRERLSHLLVLDLELPRARLNDLACHLVSDLVLSRARLNDLACHLVLDLSRAFPRAPQSHLTVFDLE